MSDAEELPTDVRPKLDAGAVCLNDMDTTLNVIYHSKASLLTSLGENGMQYLVSGARANTGVKAGRYMYEVKILESKPFNYGKPSSMSLPILRVGFSIVGSPLLLGQDNCSVCYDTSG